MPERSSTGQRHTLSLRTLRAALWTAFAFKAECDCGWNSGPFWRTRKSARLAYYRHIEAAR